MTASLHQVRITVSSALTGEDLATISASPTDSVLQLRQGIARQLGLSGTELQLTHGLGSDARLMPETGTLASIGLRDDDKVFLVRNHIPSLSVVAQTQTAFDKQLRGPFVRVSEDGLYAEHVDPSGEEMGGIVFCATPIHSVADEAYFEVRVESTRMGHQDGLVLGFCSKLPASLDELPELAEGLPSSWSYGYDGCARVDGIEGMLPIAWNPKHLHIGDRVGLLAQADRPPLLFINRETRYSLPGRVHMGEPLHAFVDLLGNTQAVSLVSHARPPPLRPTAPNAARAVDEDQLRLFNGVSLQRSSITGGAAAAVVGSLGFAFFGPLPALGLAAGAAFVATQNDSTQ